MIFLQFHGKYDNNCMRCVAGCGLIASGAEKCIATAGVNCQLLEMQSSYRLQFPCYVFACWSLCEINVILIF